LLRQGYARQEIRLGPPVSLLLIIGVGIAVVAAASTAYAAASAAVRTDDVAAAVTTTSQIEIGDLPATRYQRS